MKRTPLERFWDGVYRIGIQATVIWFAALILYLLAGALLLVVRSIELPYPVLSLDQDPGIYLLAAGAGLSISISMGGRIFSVMLAPNIEEDVLVIVILGSIVIGFGMATGYHSARIWFRSSSCCLREDTPAEDVPHTNQRAKFCGRPHCGAVNN